MCTKVKFLHQRSNFGLRFYRLVQLNLHFASLYLQIERCEDASGLALDENRLILKTPIDDSYEEEGTAEMIITIEKVGHVHAQ